MALGPDGSLYFADDIAGAIYRIFPDGILDRISGGVAVGQGDNEGFAGDGGLASDPSVRYHDPVDVAVGPDGTVYIADSRNRRVRAIGPNGVLTTIAGIGRWTSGNPRGFGNGGPAREAGVPRPIAVAVGPDGSVYMSDFRDNQIRRIRPDGIIEAFAGTGELVSNGDGGFAVDAGIQASSFNLETGPDGSVYFSESLLGFVRKIDPRGIIPSSSAAVVRMSLVPLYPSLELCGEKSTSPASRMAEAPTRRGPW